MERKIILDIFPAERDDIADLLTFRALPVPGLSDLNPFLFLNHHGPQNYEENNRGLPFGPHPHRGFETVTIILDGDVAHRDSTGQESVILAGGVQWMTAGSGIVHSEVSSEHFQRVGGSLELLQLWVNLPARLKFSPPYYLGLQKHQMRTFERDGSKVRIQLISGKWEDNPGPFPTLHPVTIMVLFYDERSRYTFQVPPGDRIFFYVISGEVRVNESKVKSREVVRFADPGDLLEISSESRARILFCHAPPLYEPISRHGPFVMNIADEVYQAIRDYKAGKFR